MKLFILLYLSLCSFLYANERKLGPGQIHVSSSSLEISGFLNHRGELFAVSDNAEDTWLYKLDFERGQANITKAHDIKKIKGYWGYYLRTFFWKRGGRWFKSAWDLEGAAACGNSFYLINEQVRHVLKIHDGAIERLNIDFEDVFKRIGKPLPEIATNAGFEGIAVDCEKNILYIAQERSPRAIIVVDLSQKKVTDFFTTSIESTPHPDYADLFFENGHLYILERNMRRILKVAPESKKTVGIASYAEIAPGFKAADLYHTGEPFGLGEALFMDADHIYVGNDNNARPFSKKAQERFGFEGNHSSVFKFKRPEGF